MKTHNQRSHANFKIKARFIRSSSKRDQILKFYRGKVEYNKMSP